MSRASDLILLKTIFWYIGLYDFIIHHIYIYNLNYFSVFRFALIIHFIQHRSYSSRIIFYEQGYMRMWDMAADKIMCKNWIKIRLFNRLVNLVRLVNWMRDKVVFDAYEIEIMFLCICAFLFLHFFPLVLLHFVMIISIYFPYLFATAKQKMSDIIRYIICKHDIWPIEDKFAYSRVIILMAIFLYKTFHHVVAIIYHFTFEFSKLEQFFSNGFS